MQNLFVIIVTFTKPKEEVEKYLEAHRNFLDYALKNGTLMLSGAQNPKVGGVIIGRFWSLDEAQAFVHQDPLCVADVASYEVTEFSPSRCIPEFEGYLRS